MSWLRRNRWWLAVLPLSVAAAAGASSYHLRDYWWDLELRHAMATAEPGEFVTFTDPFDDAIGSTSRTLSVRATSLKELASVPLGPYDDPFTLPAGVRVLQLTLDFEAEPDQQLRYCQLSLRDSRGRMYALPVNPSQGQPCVPDEHEGPDTPSVPGADRGVPDGEDRPPTWRTRPFYLVPDDVKITAAVLWWDVPDYVELPVQVSSPDAR